MLSEAAVCPSGTASGARRATARALPSSGRGYGWEWKYDGGRAIARIRPVGAVRLDLRNAKDFTPVFPEVATVLGEALPGRRLTLDGELVASSPTAGAPDFAQLQQRFGTRPSAELLAAASRENGVSPGRHAGAAPTAVTIN
jgi:ATP-dependent DNA ligase